MTKGEHKPRKNPDTHPSEWPSLSNEALEGVGGGLYQAQEEDEKLTSSSEQRYKRVSG